MKKILPLLILTNFFTVKAQWNSSPAINTPVCTAAGKQVDTRMTSDEHGGAFIAWKDSRTGVPDIYVQRIDSLGFAKWTANGVGLCTDPADQSTPAIVTDMAGGVIVAWSDWRSGVERDIYAQRIDANGNILWTTDGVGVANKQEREHNEKIVSDGKGGAIIVWEQQDPFSGYWDIWIQRINNNGAPVWQVGGLPVTTVSGYRLNPKIQKDDKSGTFVTWQDWNGWDYDVLAQRIDSSGNLMWGAGGVLVCGATGGQLSPKIDPDSISKGIVIAWADKRNGIDYDIYSQRIDSAGNMLWAGNGVPVIANAGSQSAVDFLSNPKVGGIIYSWKDSRNGANNNDIYTQKLDLNGVQQWNSSGVALCNSANDQVNPSITGDGSGGAVICWQDSSNGQWDVFTQRIDGTGNILWAANGIAVSVAAGNQTSPKNISDGYGGSIYAWQDQRTGTNDIYVHRIFYNGGNIGIADHASAISASCWPNPFVNEVKLTFSLKQEETVNIRLMNALGEELLVVVNGERMQAGEQVLTLGNKVSALSEGVYLIEIKGAHSSSVIKLLKTK